MNEIASVKRNSGPPLSAVNDWPPIVNLTSSTEPSGPLGVSAGEAVVAAQSRQQLEHPLGRLLGGLVGR